MSSAFFGAQERVRHSHDIDRGCGIQFDTTKTTRFGSERGRATFKRLKGRSGSSNRRLIFRLQVGGRKLLLSDLGRRSDDNSEVPGDHEGEQEISASQGALPTSEPAADPKKHDG